MYPCSRRIYFTSDISRYRMALEKDISIENTIKSLNITNIRDFKINEISFFRFIKKEEINMKPGVYIVNSNDLIKEMNKSKDKNANKVAIKMALDHLYRGAMDGAKNKDYIKATKECYQILKDYINKN